MSENSEPKLQTHAELAAELSAEKRKARLEAAVWKAEHTKAFIEAFRACDDVGTLRALAHRLGYKEGA